MWVHACELQMPLNARGIGSLGAGVTDELPDLDSGNQTQVF